MLLTRDTRNLRLVVVSLLTLALVLQRLDLTRLRLDFNRPRLDFDRFSGQFGVESRNFNSTFDSCDYMHYLH